MIWQNWIVLPAEIVVATIRQKRDKYLKGSNRSYELANRWHLLPKVDNRISNSIEH